MMVIGHSGSRPRPTGRRRLLAWAAVIAAYSAVMLVAGATMQKQEFFGRVVRPVIEGTSRLPIHFIRSWSAHPDTLAVDITMRDLRKLEFQARQALESGVHMVGDDDFVPGNIRHGDEKTPVRLRLKGDTVRPLMGDKWSFRVRTRGDTTLFGMKQFSLHHPRERNFAYEWLFHRALKREGILGLRYRFVDVTLNGTPLGIYALEEHFENCLLAHNDRREGPILRFSEDLMWQEIAQQTRPFPHAARSGAGSYLAAPVDGFQTSAQLADPVSASQYQQAVYLLDAFRRGQLRTSEVFEVPRLATYLALVDLFGGEHGMRWHNMRFYYDPTTSRLEPIGFDSNAGQPIQRILAMAAAEEDRYTATLFSDSEFHAEYIRQLERISSPEYLDDVLAGVGSELDDVLAILWKEFPHYRFSSEVLYRNQQYIRTVLAPVRLVHGCLQGVADHRIRLDIGNVQPLPVEVLELVLPDGSRVAPDEPLVLRGRNASRAVEFQTVVFTPPQDLPAEGPGPLELVCRVSGAAKVLQTAVALHPALPPDFATHDFMRRAPNAGDFEFLIVDQPSHTLHVRPGRWTLSRDLIVPAGYTVRCPAGTVLDLVGGAMIVTRSPLEFLGAPEKPIRIISSDGTGQGLLVVGAAGTSILEHVSFEGLTSPDKPGWAITGAVTFYESPAEIVDCRFADSPAEDALNTIRGRIEISRTVFARSRSDAFDADFCDGVIADCTFIDCGNDAIDVSGSAFRVARVQIRGAGDKGLSCGENSTVLAEEIQLSDSRLAIASKDMSDVSVQRAAITDCQYGLSAFQKKPEFGPATLRVAGASITNTAHPYLVEERSRLIVDDRPVEPNTSDASAILYDRE